MIAPRPAWLPQCPYPKGERDAMHLYPDALDKQDALSQASAIMALEDEGLLRHDAALDHLINSGATANAYCRACRCHAGLPCTKGIFCPCVCHRGGIPLDMRRWTDGAGAVVVT